MIVSENGKPTRELRLSVDEWPMTGPAYTYVLPRLALAFAFKQKAPVLTISYEDAAEVIRTFVATYSFFITFRACFLPRFATTSITFL